MKKYLRDTSFHCLFAVFFMVARNIWNYFTVAFLYISLEQMEETSPHLSSWCCCGLILMPACAGHFPGPCSAALHFNILSLSDCCLPSECREELTKTAKKTREIYVKSGLVSPLPNFYLLSIWLSWSYLTSCILLHQRDVECGVFIMLSKFKCFIKGWIWKMRSQVLASI